MDLGIGLFTCQQRPDDNRPMSEIYDEMLTLGRTIDGGSLDSAWVSEHHFLSDGYLSGVPPALGALAAVTDDIELGSCIALAPLYDSVRLAEDAATIDLIADGRLTLGLAIGSNPREFDAFGIPRDERVARLVDTVEVLRGAWSDGPLNYDPEFHEIPRDIHVTPRPAHSIPIMIGGTARPAVRRAARRGNAWAASSSLSIDGIRKRKEDIEKIRERENLSDDFDIHIIQYGFVGTSDKEAWETMRDGYYYTQRRYQEIFSGDRVEDLSKDYKQELKENAIFGTPEQVVTQLNEYREALGDNIHFIYRVYHPGVGTQRMIRCVERLSDEVYPQIC